VDLTRSLVRVFIPLSVVGALVLVSQGAVQNFSGFRAALTLAGGTQDIPGGPVTSMEVIKLLGTNGGSFYGAGSAHPFENPTGFSNMFELLLVIVLPSSCSGACPSCSGPAPGRSSIPAFTA
jgi:potassium-transporting ATPase potassium-binding subunit